MFTYLKPKTSKEILNNLSILEPIEISWKLHRKITNTCELEVHEALKKIYRDKTGFDWYFGIDTPRAILRFEKEEQYKWKQYDPFLSDYTCLDEEDEKTVYILKT